MSCLCILPVECSSAPATEVFIGEAAGTLHSRAQRCEPVLLYLEYSRQMTTMFKKTHHKHEAEAASRDDGEAMTLVVMLVTMTVTMMVVVVVVSNENIFYGNKNIIQMSDRRQSRRSNHQEKQQRQQHTTSSGSRSRSDPLSCLWHLRVVTQINKSAHICLLQMYAVAACIHVCMFTC